MNKTSPEMRHAEMARQIVSGRKPKEVAEEFGISLTTIYKLIKTPLFQDKMDEIAKEYDELVDASLTRYMSAVGKAVQNHIDIIMDDKPLDKKLQLEVSSKLIESAKRRRWGTDGTEDPERIIRLQQINIYADRIKDVTDIREITRLLEEQRKL